MSISVFSTHFIECQINYLTCTQAKRRDEIEEINLSEAFDAWIARPDLKQRHWCPQLLMSLHPEDEIADKYIFNRVCADYRLGKVSQWATDNILLKIRADWKLQTRNVKYRIVAGMLNKLVDNNCITHDQNIYIFNNIVKNMQTLRNDLLDSDLPFCM